MGCNLAKDSCFFMPLSADMTRNLWQNCFLAHYDYEEDVNTK